MNGKGAEKRFLVVAGIGEDVAAMACARPDAELGLEEVEIRMGIEEEGELLVLVSVPVSAGISAKGDMILREVCWSLDER